MDALEEGRIKIDEVNSKIVGLLAERVKAVKKIGRYKAENGIGIVDSKREEKIYRRLRKEAREQGLDEEYVEKVFRVIIEYSRGIQNDKSRRR